MSLDDTQAPALPGATCPICCWPDQGTAVCRNCGWELRGEYLIGRATPEDERQLLAQVESKRRHFDLRAAVRAASWPERDNTLLSRLASLARGTPPRLEEIESAADRFDAEEPREHRSEIGVGYALGRLVSGETQTIRFVEISPDGVSVEVLEAGDLDVSVPRFLHSIPWPNVLPALSDDEGLRRFRLVGGVVDATATEPADIENPSDLAAMLSAGVRRLLARLLPTASAAVAGQHGAGTDDPSAGHGGIPARADTILVRRTRHWPLLETAAASTRAAIRPVAEIYAPGDTALSGIVRETASRAPLRYGYDLVLVAVDARTGAVRIEPQPLFAAGTMVRPGHRPTADVTVTAPVSAADRLALPIVARRGTDPAGWPRVTVATMDGTTSRPVDLQIRLTAPGRVTIRLRPEMEPASGRVPGWPGLLAEQPDRVLDAMALDMVVLIELGGSTGTVARRVALATGMAARLRGAEVRLAVVGYRDHFTSYKPDTSAPDEALIVSSGMHPIDETVAALEKKDHLWQAVGVGDDRAAPVEDALKWIADRDWRWRPDVRHLLMVLGSRPPHRAGVARRGRTGRSVCPYRVPWEHYLTRLRDDHAVECVAVLDADAPHDQGDEGTGTPWDSLGAHGLFTLETCTPDHLARAIGFPPGKDTAPLYLATLAERTPRDKKRGNR